MEAKVIFVQCETDQLRYCRLCDSPRTLKLRFFREKFHAVAAAYDSLKRENDILHAETTSRLEDLAALRKISDLSEEKIRLLETERVKNTETITVNQLQILFEFTMRSKSAAERAKERISSLETSLASSIAEVDRLTDLCQVLQSESVCKTAKLSADHESLFPFFFAFMSKYFKGEIAGVKEELRIKEVTEVALRDELVQARTRLEALESAVVQQSLQQGLDEGPLVQLLNSTKEALRLAQAEVNNLKADRLLFEDKISAGEDERLQMRGRIEELEVSIASIASESQLRENKLEEVEGACCSLHADNERLNTMLHAKEQLIAELEKKFIDTKSCNSLVEQGNIEINADLLRLRAELGTEKVKFNELTAQNQVMHYVPLNAQRSPDCSCRY